jgi:pimeloyl-ACP methyl ester carboxylesterase
VPDTGESLLSIFGDAPSWIVVQDDGRTLPDASRVPEIVCQRCDAESQRLIIEQARPMALAPFGEPVAEASWRQFPSTYVVCTEDLALPVEVQRGVFAPRAEEVVELETDHFPQFSRPGEVAEILASRA